MVEMNIRNGFPKLHNSNVFEGDCPGFMICDYGSDIYTIKLSFGAWVPHFSPLCVRIVPWEMSIMWIMVMASFGYVGVAFRGICSTADGAYIISVIVTYVARQ